MRKACWLLLFALSCAGDLPTRSEVSRLRILAVRAAPPSMRPDEATHLDVLIADPFGIGRPLTVTWTACVNPPGDDPLRCLGREDAWTLPGGLDTVLLVPESLRPGGNATVGLVVHVCAGAILEGAVPPLCDGPGEVAVKRVALSMDPLNENPEIASITFGAVEVPADADGLAIPACVAPCPRYLVSVEPTSESEQLVIDDAGAARRESLLVAFAADGGSFVPSFAEGASFEADFTPAPGERNLHRLWIVLHDERGGVDFRTLVVRTRTR